MKSIEEFATEYAQDKYMPVQTSQAVKAGANYVLGEIEKALNYALDNLSIRDGYIKAREVIEQLKG